MANLHDVAKKAEVSIATVSRVLNNASNVNPETVAKVKKAIKSLNYKPNRVAQRLRVKDGSRKLIGLLVPDIQNPFYVEVIRGVEEIAQKNDYAVLMGNFAQDPEKHNMYVNLMISESVDGLIVAPTNERDSKVIELIKSGFPIVYVDRGIEDVDVDVVLVDNYKGAYTAIKHIIQCGHTKIAYIAGLPSIPTTIQRKRGYEDALNEHNIPFNESYVKFGNSKHESGKELTRELLSLPDPPTAVFTGNNLITLGALESIHQMGLKIPDDVAIVGFDDMPWSISLNPPLTAISQPGFEIGKRAAIMLINRIAEPDRPAAKIILNTQLIIRNSC